MFDYLNVVLFTIVLIVVIYPLYFILISSISSPGEVAGGKVWLWPVDPSLEGYRSIFTDSTIWLGYKNSLIYTTLGVVISTSLTITAAYSLSRKDLAGRNIVLFYFLFTMFFSGGLIPNYILVKNLGMLDTIWAMVIPGAVSVFQLIIARTFFQYTIPDDLLEAAQMDGCNDFRFFFRIVLPLSLPIISVIILYNAVSQWNAYFKALVYLTDHQMQPLQMILRRILIQNEATEGLPDTMSLIEQQRQAELVKYGVIVVACIPMLVLYPFLQKYFVKGIMIGSVKG
jgi:putative aldouronate transport system permease protein